MTSYSLAITHQKNYSVCRENCSVVCYRVGLLPCELLFVDYNTSDNYFSGKLLCGLLPCWTVALWTVLRWLLHIRQFFTGAFVLWPVPCPTSTLWTVAVDNSFSDNWSDVFSQHVPDCCLVDSFSLTIHSLTNNIVWWDSSCVVFFRVRLLVCGQAIDGTTAFWGIESNGICSKGIQTHTRFRIMLFIRTKHNMRVFGVMPFIKLQNDT